MIYYIFKAQIFTIFLSINHLTAIHFHSPIKDYVGGQKRDFMIHELNNKKSLVFETKRSKIKKNFMVFFKEGNYHFNLVSNHKFKNQNITIKEARSCHALTLIKETKTYQLFNCPKSLLFINKGKSPANVNNLIIKNRAYLSKGPPVMINKKMIYYRGILQ